ncbi:hypothetical protein H6F96_03980 [Microcoleus sp. FACHB-53]|nr:hypothetical protein [Microcoleus sp. FACHB-53]MBD2128586.1 hypothetical protein [Microcoleus sp. FACHB-1]
MVKHLKYADECGRACNPMTYLERVNSLRPVRFLIGECDPLVNVAAAKACASQFPWLMLRRQKPALANSLG